ncbi:2-succinyl-5-enolpyruvyl-6-hydroxy-3-cyclohexene-1-carboxylate synthase [Hyella patelloides LEGE 07179]|uniref:2-succinyl-5-enolpyruvyl-6-hydroxy-3-cyclohexene-1-carboxylate synthase n=1 Tax=Hyella patelloides LEGE 07179 TaxID=945734 RepID=A0A563VNV5_9CYAN|nr:2-succinyl-5-enolpyruvyl-6-hydroxy-3-cyclohexene-1-carboxylic-acid synthase [Hyella patelloides]VEP13013.1 2-succinyl-5-enolpyruvyl-6-hydroxy-3-cyclohexene-1-carboxylate synthase [Hyella patelloides LEGE 07179]
MLLDSRNVNTLWCSVLVETLVCLGLKDTVICPGSRSTPLTIAFAKHPQVRTIPILDERSAAFFALGKAKRTHLPVVLVCSSGTAGANFYPAIIEAKETGVPLIVLTADRPPELRHCHAGQTIDQIKLYGNYPNWYTELAIPEANREMLCYLRQHIVQAWEKSLFPFRGVVHLNCPFREPLAPIIQPEIQAKMAKFAKQDFFSHLRGFNLNNNIQCNMMFPSLKLDTEGIIISGLTQTEHPEKYCQEIALLAKKLQFPVLAEALSPLRNYARLNPYLITTYDTILREPTQAAKLQPKVIIQIGELPTSKQLRNWLSSVQATRYIITCNQENFDPLHSKTIHLRTSIKAFTKSIITEDIINNVGNYLKNWCELETKTIKAIAEKLRPLDNLYEGKTAWLISQHLPPKTPIFLANSMSVRNAEFFWQPNNSQVIPYFNRGANGIDGTLSTALGIADGDRPTVILSGDLALLHDTNGFLINNHFSGHLTIIVINNNGGGIFETLPISQFDPPFEEYFAIPQNINFAQLCKTYGVEYKLIDNWQQLPPLLNPLPKKGMRLLEIKTDRKQDASWLKNDFWRSP